MLHISKQRRVSLRNHLRPLRWPGVSSLRRSRRRFYQNRNNHINQMSFIISNDTIDLMLPFKIKHQTHVKDPIRSAAPNSPVRTKCSPEPNWARLLLEAGTFTAACSWEIFTHPQDFLYFLVSLWLRCRNHRFLGKNNLKVPKVWWHFVIIKCEHEALLSDPEMWSFTQPTLSYDD